MTKQVKKKRMKKTWAILSITIASKIIIILINVTKNKKTSGNFGNFEVKNLYW